MCITKIASILCYNAESAIKWILEKMGVMFWRAPVLEFFRITLVKNFHANNNY